MLMRGRGHITFKYPAYMSDFSLHRDGGNTKSLNTEQKIQNRIPKSHIKKTKKSL